MDEHLRPVIRAFERDDIGAVGQLLEESCWRLWRFDYTPDQIEAMLRGYAPDHYFIDAFERGERMFVTVWGGQIFGYASWFGHALNSLFVHPDSLGRGVGRALFEACEADALAQGSRLTEVRATLNLIGYFTRLGFGETERTVTPKHGVSVPIAIMARRAVHDAVPGIADRVGQGLNPSR